MRLIKQEKNGCVYAAVGMLIKKTPDEVFNIIDAPMGPKERHPFPEPWSHLPFVPTMDVIVDRLIKREGIALVQFKKNPTAAPHPDCPPYDVWAPYKRHDVFNSQLKYGRGLIEGTVGEVGHMVAWDGSVVFDPRGYCYSMNVADRFNFTPLCFWLAVTI